MNFVDYVFEESKKSEGNAVLDKHRNTSYKELHKRVLQIAKHFGDTNTKSQKIGIISDNNLFFITAYFGIMKSNNVVVPLPTKISHSELKSIIKECDMKTIFVQEKYKEDVKEKIETITEKDLEEIHENPHHEKEIEHEEELAAIIFSSGSTGKSKGVMLTHKNLIANTSSIVRYLELTSKDIQLSVLPLYYCYGASLLHTHLKVGGSIVFNNTFILTQTVVRDLLEYECTGFAGVPSTYQILLKKSHFKTTKFPKLRYITQAGGKLTTEFIKQIIESHPEIDLYVMYGQTEATSRLSYLPPEILKEKLGSIGKGIPGVTLKLVDEAGKEVPTGEVGEILANGDNVMKGYFNDVEETEKTLADGWLRTGDLATQDEEGYFYIYGRKKNIIKSGGHRISPKEIEEVILEIPEMRECVVFGVEDALLGEIPKAVVVETQPETITAEEIKDYCRTKLPSYKIPKHVEIVDELPLNTSHKVDVHKIKELYG